MIVFNAFNARQNSIFTRVLVSALLCAGGIVGAAAQENPVEAGGAFFREPAILVYYHYGIDQAPPDLVPSIEYAVYAVDAAFYDAGIEARMPYIAGDAESVSFERLQEYCEEFGVNWAIAVSTMYSEGRLTWRFSIYGMPDSVARASETFWTPLYAGVSTAAPIDASAEQLVYDFLHSFVSTAYGGEKAVSVAQRFVAEDDGMNVYFGGTDGIFAGTTENHALTAPLLLFERDIPVFGTAVKDGYWSEDFVLSNGVTDEPFRLPKLIKKSRQSAALMFDTRHITSLYPGMGASFEYRFYPVADRVFLKAAYSLWSKSSPLDDSGRGGLFHELRFGVGLNIMPNHAIPFRLIVGTGASAVFSGGAHFLADPFWIGAEYHFSRFAVIGEFRLPEIFSYSRDVFGGGVYDFGFCLSFGVLLKW
jgi:hypothetical protein